MQEVPQDIEHAEIINEETELEELNGSTSADVKNSAAERWRRGVARQKASNHLRFELQDLKDKRDLEDLRNKAIAKQAALDEYARKAAVEAAGEAEIDEADIQAAVQQHRKDRIETALQDAEQQRREKDATLRIQSLQRGRIARKRTASIRRLGLSVPLNLLYPFFTSDRAADNSPAMLKVRMLESDPKLEELDFEFSCIGHQGAQWLGAAIKRHSSLKTLNLKGNYMYDIGARRVAGGLLVNQSITDINLAWNSIGDDGLMKLCHVFVKTKTIRRCDLAYNRVGDLGIQALALSIDVNPVLKWLNLEGNRFGREAAGWIIHACKKNRVELHLPLNGITDLSGGRSFDEMFMGFLDSDIPRFLKAALIPVVRGRFGALADQMLPEEKVNDIMEEFEPTAKVDTGLGELRSKGFALVPSGQTNSRKGSKPSASMSKSSSSSKLRSKGNRKAK